MVDFYGKCRYNIPYMDAMGYVMIYEIIITELCRKYHPLYALNNRLDPFFIAHLFIGHQKKVTPQESHPESKICPPHTYGKMGPQTLQHQVLKKFLSLRVLEKSGAHPRNLTAGT